MIAGITPHNAIRHGSLLPPQPKRMQQQSSVQFGMFPFEFELLAAEHLLPQPADTTEFERHRDEADTNPPLTTLYGQETWEADPIRHVDYAGSRLIFGKDLLEKLHANYRGGAHFTRETVVRDLFQTRRRPHNHPSYDAKTIALLDKIAPPGEVMKEDTANDAFNDLLNAGLIEPVTHYTLTDKGSQAMPPHDQKRTFTYDAVAVTEVYLAAKRATHSKWKRKPFNRLDHQVPRQQALAFLLKKKYIQQNPPSNNPNGPFMISHKGKEALGLIKPVPEQTRSGMLAFMANLLS